MQERGRVIRSLVIIQNAMRGSRVTSDSLLNVGLRDLDFDLAYCGAKAKEQTDLYSGRLIHRWELEEPESWRVYLEETLPSSLWDYFFNVRSRSGITRSESDVQLWTSGFVQATFRRRALEHVFELNLEQKYSWFIFVRSDFFFLNPLPALQTLDKSPILVVDSDHNGGINDRLVAVPAGHIREFAKITDVEILSGRALMTSLAEAWRDEEIRNPESLYRFQVEKLGLIDHFRAIPQLGFCVRESQDGTRWSLGLWSSRRRLYIKYPTELILAKIAGLRSSFRKRIHPPMRSFRRREPLLVRLVMQSKWAPRVLMAPLLCLVGEFQLGIEIWKVGGRFQVRMPEQEGHRASPTSFLDISDKGARK